MKYNLSHKQYLELIHRFWYLGDYELLLHLREKTNVQYHEDYYV